MLARSSTLAVAVGVCLWLGGCSSCDKPSGSKKLAPAVASLSALGGKVNHRAARSLTWRGASVGMALRHRDALRTGKGARATVTFKRGGVLKVDELSLIVIEAPPPSGGSGGGSGSSAASAAPVAKLERGTLRGVARPGAPLRIVGADGKTIEIKAQGQKPVPFRARVGAKGVELAVLGGAAKVSTGGQTVPLSKGQVVDVARGGRISRPVRLPGYPALLEPAVDAKLALDKPVTLRWSPVDSARRYRVQVSTSTSFDPLVFSRRVTRTEVRIATRKLEPTTLYLWRVAAVSVTGHEGEFGFARRFGTLERAAAKDGGAPSDASAADASAALPSALVFPPDNAKVRTIRGKPRTVGFRWKGEKKGKYVLVVARSADLKRRVVAKILTRGTETVVRKMRVGDYYWGVYRVVRKAKGRRKKGKKGKKAKVTLEPIFANPQRLRVINRRPPAVAVPRAIKWKK